MLGLLLLVSRHFQSANTVLQIYQITVRPILEYRSVISGYIRVDTDQKIQAVQKRVFLIYNSCVSVNICRHMRPSVDIRELC